jgi:class 3 adenylate cyclase
VVFLDLRGYTSFTEEYGADEVMRVLGEFHAAMGQLDHGNMAPPWNDSPATA